MLTIAFLGAAGTVTGSKFAVRYGSEHLLVDCGLFQGLDDAEALNRQSLPIPARQFAALVLTHAHTDHAGGIPRLVSQGFEGPVFCTEPTHDLCQLLLLDSARLQQEWATQELPALYDEEDAKDALELMVTQPYYEKFEVLPGVRATFRDAGHILGSAWVELEFQPLPDWPRQESVVVVFSGDVGRGSAPMLAPPDRPERADFLVLESTYGAHRHSGAVAAEQLAESVARVRKDLSTLVIPAFAIQRSQDLAYLFEGLLADGEIEPTSVFLDSPMACRALHVYEEYPDYLSYQAGSMLNEHGRLLRYPFLQACLHSRQSRAILDFRPPRVVISASGMAQGGRVLHHLRHHLPEPDSLILMAGYQCPGTRGRELMEGADQVEIDGRQVPVRARVEMLDGLSGHADYLELEDWLADLRQSPARTYLVHGDEPSLSAQQSRLQQQRGWQVEVPRHQQEFVLVP